MRYITALCLLLFSFVCFAAIYMQTDKEGNLIYSDVPEDHATAITLPNTENNISVPKTSTSNSESASSPAPAEALQKGGAHKNYTTFIITDPTDQKTFQNQRDIPITIKIDPPLQEGDKVQLYVDGIPAGQPSTDLTQLAVHQVDRGEHQISATLLDAADHVLSKTDNLTIFIHYSAIPTGSNAIAPSSISGNGITPSSPGSGITTPAQAGSGLTPPAQSGTGATPPAQSGSGITPPSQSGSGIVPPAKYGSGIVPGR